MNNLDFLSIIDEKKQLLEDTALFLWEHPETAFTEFESAKYLCKVLRDEGFEVTENLAGISTAFCGRFGSGKPVIGLLGEFDALSGLSQTAAATEKCTAGGDAGHGCGHNLLGTGSLGAAITAKRYLEMTGKPGTVIYYGCPGEEGGSGKAFMARDGVFDELDAALCWHPSTMNAVRVKTSLANCQVLYKFDGQSAHAGVNPHLGRSALDAVELMNVGVNYMREHMISAARVHYAITDTGGFSPNVVQPHAEVLYLIRAPHNSQVKELYERVCNIAEGAALMTGTRASHDFIKACSNTVLNHPIQQTMYEIMQALGDPVVTEEDIAYAKALTEAALMGNPKADPEAPIALGVDPYTNIVEASFGSTDVGDVSWVCPTAQIFGACLAKGTPGHSWQQTTQSAAPLALRTTLYVSKVLGATAVELLTDPDLLARAKEEHRRLVGPKGYECPIPKGVEPRSMSSLSK